MSECPTVSSLGLIERASACLQRGEFVRGSELAWRQALVVAPPGAPLPEQTRRRLQRALIQLRNGGCWLVHGRDLVIDPTALDRLAKSIQTFQSKAEAPELRDCVCEDLECVLEEVRPMRFDDFSAEAWPLRAIAVEIVVQAAIERQRQGLLSEGAESSLAVDNLTVQLRGEWQRHLDAFRSTSVDPEVEEVARNFGSEGAVVYDYLRNEAHRRNRLQVAKSAPLFLPMIARNDDAFRGVRLAIDEGRPLLPILSGLCDVSAAVLRIIRSAEAAQAGRRWTPDPIALARLIERIRPDLRPRSETQWARFNEAVELFERASGSTVDTGIFGLLWLQEALLRERRKGGLSARGANAIRQPGYDAEEQRQVEGLRRILLGVLAAELRPLDSRQVAAWPAQLVWAIDEEMNLGGRKYWIKVAKAMVVWLSTASSSASVETMATELAAGHRTWPITASPFITRDGGQIRTLRSAPELAAHGEKMNICLADTYLQKYARFIRSGRRFVLALFDSSGEPQSTAELGISSRSIEGRWCLNVRQHTGHANAEPDVASRQQLDELLQFLATPAGQQHIRLGVQLMQGFQGRVARGPSAAELLSQVRALNAGLSPAACTALRSRCATRLSARLGPVSIEPLMPSESVLVSRATRVTNLFSS